MAARMAVDASGWRWMNWPNWTYRANSSAGLVGERMATRMNWPNWTYRANSSAGLVGERMNWPNWTYRANSSAGLVEASGRPVIFSWRWHFY